MQRPDPRGLAVRGVQGRGAEGLARSSGLTLAFFRRQRIFGLCCGMAVGIHRGGKHQ